MRLTCLTRYDETGASSRVRFVQYFARLKALIPGLDLRHQALLDAGYLHRKYARQSAFGPAVACYARRLACGDLWRSSDLWWIEKELLPWVPAVAERLWLSRQPYVIDLDDAIFHNYDRHRSALVRQAYGGKIDSLFRNAALVIAGNSYLCERARRAGARWVEILPTVIDLTGYDSRKVPSIRLAEPDAAVKIAWIGTPATVHYLQQLAAPLRRLAKEYRVTLVVIGARVEFPGVSAVSLPWSPGDEAAQLAACDVGVMPLEDSPWERGKCGYKLIQYMACSLPVVASPVGANRQIVQDRVNGLLARDASEWYDALKTLVMDKALRRRLGAAGRHIVEREYCSQVTAPRLAAWLEEAARQA